MHLFEFMDHPNIPASLRTTLLETLECCNSRIRPYYQQVVERIVRQSRQESYQTIVELGAGSAPLSRRLAADGEIGTARLVPCDQFPDSDTYRELERLSPNSVFAMYAPVDFLKVTDWGPQSALILCAAFHHVPEHLRTSLIGNLTRSSTRVMIFEPLRKTPFSIFLASLAFLPALLVPLLLVLRPGRLRRLLWCYLVPIVPLMFTWDAIVSCLRQWSRRQWLSAGTPADRPLSVENDWHSQVVIW